MGCLISTLATNVLSDHGRPAILRCRALGVYLALVAAVLVSRPARAQVTLDTLSLWRLDSVRVEVEPFIPAASEDGLDRDTIRLRVERRLLEAGLGLLSPRDWQVTMGNPMLIVRINLTKPSEFFYLYALDLELKQLVRLVRDSTIPAFATTWSADNRIGSVQPQTLERLVDYVVEMVEQFLATRRAAQMLTPPRLDGEVVPPTS